jgi:hypothetical protein
MPIAEVKQSRLDKLRLSQIAAKLMAEARAHPVRLFITTVSVVVINSWNQVSIDDGEKKLVSIFSGIERIENIPEGMKLANFIAFVIGGSPIWRLHSEDIVISA